MTSEYLLVVDFGTSSVKVSAVDPLDGSTFSSKSTKYEWIHPKPGLTEMNPDEMWECSQEVVGTLLEEMPDASRCLAFTFSFFGDNVIPVDESGDAVDNLIPSIDGRSRDQVPQLLGEVNRETYYRITGGQPHVLCIGSKILWLKEHRPDVFERADYFDHIQQYVFRKLGFGGVSDYPMASRKMFYDIHEHEWATPLIEPLGIRVESLHETLHESTTIMGSIDSYGKVDLPDDIPVVLGSHDVTCAMIGTGATAQAEGLLGNVIGSWDIYVRIVSDPDFSYEVADERCWFYCGPTKDTYSFMALLPAGALLEWFVDELRSDDSSDTFEKLFAQMEFDGRNQILVLPYFDQSIGSVFGLDFSATQLQLFQSFVEGICFESRSILMACDRFFDSPIERVCAGGGGSRSGKWLQLKSDVTDTTFQSVSNPEISTLGAAVIGACALGIYDDLEQGSSNMVSIGHEFEPERETVQRYNENYRRYRTLIDAIRSSELT